MAAAHAAMTNAGVGAPNHYEWWFNNWHVQQEVWPLTQGAGVTVAVLDSGVQASVPDLRGAVLPGADMTDPSNNGDTDNHPGAGHGTAVASLIAGRGHGTGMMGLAPQGKILPVIVGVATASILNQPALVGEGIRYAVAHGAQVINVSLGYATHSAASCDADLQDAVAYAVDHNAVVVAGSGDTALTGAAPVEPASCAGVLAVGGVEPDGSLWSGSTQQPYVAVAAPSDHMADTGKDGQLYIESDGTSLSSPLVAAAAALIRSEYPSMPWYQVDQRITATAIPEGTVPNNGYGYGILDLPHAVNSTTYPVPAGTPNPVYAKFQAWLASPDGQAHARQRGGTGSGGGPHSHQASQPPASHSRFPGAVLLLGVVLAAAGLAAIIVMAIMRANRKSSLRQAGYGVSPAQTRSGMLPPPHRKPGWTAPPSGGWLEQDSGHQPDSWPPHLQTPPADGPRGSLPPPDWR